VLGVGLTNLPCKKENCCEASKKFSRILWRRPRHKLGCGAKERRRRRRRILGEAYKLEFNHSVTV
jgi:hypothetical protein